MSDGSSSLVLDDTADIPDPPHGTVSAIELDGTAEDDGRPPLTPEQREHVKRTDRIEALDDALTAVESLIRQAAATVALRFAEVVAGDPYVAKSEAWREFTGEQYEEVGDDSPGHWEFDRFRDFTLYYLDRDLGTPSRASLLETLLIYAPDEYLDQYGCTVDSLKSVTVYRDALRRKDVRDDARKIHRRISKNIERADS